MYYRTRTYVAGDWDGDKEAIELLQKWNEGDKWLLSFSDAHKLMQARDDSLNCSIKKSLLSRLNASKRFVLIAGKETKTRRAGKCQYCNKFTYCINKSAWTQDYSFIEYECYEAVKQMNKGNMDIVVLYNGAKCWRHYCPDLLYNVGIHIPMHKVIDGIAYWDYKSIKNLFA